MKITINGRQLSVYDETKELVKKKIAKLDKFFDADAEAVVTLSVKHGEKNIELTIVNAGTVFRAEVQDETFRSAFDRAVTIIERQIRKNKTRLGKRIHEVAFDDVFPEDTVEEETEFNIRTKTFSIKPMSIEEAIMQMNLLDHQFFVFKNPEEETCVVYRRKDGDYGLIVPQ